MKLSKLSCLSPSKFLTAYSSVLLCFDGISASPVPDDWSSWKGCSRENLRVRKEWGDLKLPERKAYINAVLCLQSKPTTLNQAAYPGVRSRYDDFVATHINYTSVIHLNAQFLSWHRNYVWLYENALRDECGYIGTQPYWDWPKYQGKLHESPIFDGSEYSLSGDGAPNGTAPYVLGPTSYPHGTGGGCVLSGPFKDYQISLGPFDFGLIFALQGALPPNAFAPNPRCLTRDLNDAVNLRFCNSTSVDELLAQPTIQGFQDFFSGPPGIYEIGPHPGGHLSVGADMFDFWASPNDPAFFVHHAMVDKMWHDWQMKDPKARVYGDNALYGTKTILNIPPSANLTMQDYEPFGPLDQDRKVMDLMSTMAGPFCYVYA